MTSASKKILIACSHFWPSVGGLETSMAQLGGELVAAGYEVAVMTLAFSARTADHHQGVQIISVEMADFQRAIRAAVASGEYATCLLIQDPLGHIIWSVEQLQPPAHTRVLIQPIINEDGYARWKDNADFRQRLAGILKGAGAALTMTKSGPDHRFMLEEGIEPVYLPNASSLTAAAGDFRQQLGIPADRFVILHVANLYWVKNHVGLIDALAGMPDNWQLVMIGTPTGATDCVEAVYAKLASRPEIKFVPGLPPEWIAAAMQAADVVVLASHGEGSPITLLEAMSHGKPWLATPQCGAANDHLGGLIGDLPSFMPRLRQLAAQPALRHGLGELSRAHWTQCYSWPVVLRGWMDLIETGRLQRSFAPDQELVARMQQIQQALELPAGMLPREPAAGGPALQFLNIGTGNAALAGLVSISPAPGADVQHDLSQGLPFADRSIAGIYCENHLEYLNQEQGLLFLRECRRVLVHGGVLRVVTPDLEAMLATYAAQSARGAARHEWIDNPAEALNLQMRLQDRQWTYSAQDLARAAVLAGLDDAVRRQPGESGMAPLAGQTSGAPGQLIMEFSLHEPQLDAHPLVSIVIPGYRARYFEAALASALAQTYDKLEIIVLDDSANDEIRQLIQASGAGERIRYLKNTPQLGEGHSLTRGIREARGQLIKPLYDDDVLLPQCVARMVAGMQACPQATLAIARRYTINSAGQRYEEQTLAVANASCEMSGLSLAAFTLATGRNFIGPPSAVMLRRADALTMAPTVMSFSGFEIKGAGDVALYLHLLGRGDCVYLHDLLSEFRVHDNHTSSDPAIFAHERNSWMFLKHHGRRLGLMPADTNLRIKRPL